MAYVKTDLTCTSGNSSIIWTIQTEAVVPSILSVECVAKKDLSVSKKPRLILSSTSVCCFLIPAELDRSGLSSLDEDKSDAYWLSIFLCRCAEQKSDALDPP